MYNKAPLTKFRINPASMYTTVYLGNFLDLLQYLNLGTVVATCTSRESFTAVVHVIIIGRIPAIAACFEFGPAAAYMYWFNLNKNSQFARSFRPEKRSSGTIILNFFKNSVTAGPAGPAVTANMRMVPLNNLDVANGPAITNSPLLRKCTGVRTLAGLHCPSSR